MSELQFKPNWASPPGDTISEILDEKGLSIIEFGERIGMSTAKVADLLQGRSTITLSLARKLEGILGPKREFWMSRDFQYREDADSLNKREKRWLMNLPLGDMIKFGWFNSVPHPSEELDSCLNFFGVRSIDDWEEKYKDISTLVAFKKSPTFDSSPSAVAAWLRQGEIISEEIPCNQWNASDFQDSLKVIRGLTKNKDPEQFIPELQHICAKSGVSVVILRAPTGCRASGATKFLSNKKALILLSFRYLTDDHFWFTFFHEAGHLLLHDQGSIFIEGDGHPSDALEEAANEFARNILIPEAKLPELLKLPLNGRKVAQFAFRIGISPGIVVGQLQHSGIIRYNQLNQLKRRFTWSD